MKVRIFASLLFSIFVLTSANSLKTKPAFTYKVYGNIANYFENENDLLGFFEFTKGDRIAEVGAANGPNIGGLSILTDNVTYYAEDINARALNEKNFNKVIKRCSKYKEVQTNDFHICVGTDKATGLPNGIFDKIFLSATFHELVLMDEMMTDIRKKIKTGGKLYILESHCSGKGHKNYTAEEAISIVKKYNFSLVRRDGKDLNGSAGLYRLVFAKEDR